MDNTSIRIEIIENGYLVVNDRVDENGIYKYERWYAISPEEVKQKLDKFL